MHPLWPVEKKEEGKLINNMAQEHGYIFLHTSESFQKNQPIEGIGEDSEDLWVNDLFKAQYLRIYTEWQMW